MMGKSEEPSLFLGRRASLVLAAAVAFITFVIYLPALQNDFVNWDDFDYAYENYHIRAIDWTFIKWAFTDTSLAGYWYPLVWLSHALDYALWGLNPLGHHLTSIIFHSANAFLVVFLVIRLLEASNEVGGSAWSSPFLSDRRVLIAAGTTGLLFGLHPLHVESAVWISERKDLLYALFTLLSIMAYAGYVRGLEKEPIRGNVLSFLRNRRYLLSVAFFVLALSCKAMAVTLPVVLLLLDWYPFKRWGTRQGFIRSFVEKTPFMVFSLIITIVSLAGQKALGALSHLESVGLPVRLIVASKALMMYLWKMATPIDLLPFYPYPEDASLLGLEYLVPLMLVGVITAGCFFLAKKSPFWLSLWGYYVITMLPVIGIIPIGTHFMADRYTYLPSLGPFLLAGLAAAWFWTKTDLLKQGHRALKGLAVGAAISLLVLLCVLTLKQIGIWKNSIVFWSYLIEKEGARVPVAYEHRGLAFVKEGQFDRAIDDYTKAITLKPDYPDYYSNRGVAFRAKGQNGLAMEDFEKAISVDPRFPDAYVNRGILFKERGQIERAFEDFTMAITLNPKQDAAYYARGMILQEIGQLEPAIEDFTMVIILNPSFAEAYNNRGLLFARIGRLDQALDDLNAAVRLNPSGVEAYNNRGLVFENMGKFDEAIEDYSSAIKLNPLDYLSYSNRGIVFDKQGRTDKAIEDQTKVISLKPDLEKAYLDRGELYAKVGKPALAIGDLKEACRLGSTAGCQSLRTIVGAKER